ncbi:N-formylglutamate amidohydrolase [Agrobacterium sp.]|uniref:N-formylglutamate amidohydrolase n=1 Tax=Agrobacterium sp. TaxID=361 RepID=UPI0028A684E5
MTLRSRFFTDAEGDTVAVENADAVGDVLLICEHASREIPEYFGTLGLDANVLSSHIAWDPGALAVSRLLVGKLDATLVYQRYSRLIYDCNRPPESVAAMPSSSEIYEIPGNRQISDAERFARTSAVYMPFHEQVDDIIAARLSQGRQPVIVTIHSFTPVYYGQLREVQVGILHDVDSRLADGMLAAAKSDSPEGGKSYQVERNQPYGPEDGVTHTLRLHALPEGLLNVMIEIRNDLIRDEKEQEAAADFVAGLVKQALSSLAR